MLRVAALLVAIMILPTAVALQFSDGAGDQQLGRITHHQDGEAQTTYVNADEQGWYQNVDVLSASVEETDADLIFTVQLASEDVNQPEDVEWGPKFEEFIYVFQFNLGGRDYDLAFYPSWFDEDEVLFGELWFLEDSPRRVDYFGSMFMGTPALPNEDGAGWTGVLAKSRLRDANMVPLREGHVLKDIRVKALGIPDWQGSSTCPSVDSGDPLRSNVFDMCRWDLRDEVGSGALGDLTITTTPPGAGHVFVLFDNPYRASNGLATTYLFEVDVHVLEKVKDTIRFQVSDIPASWEVRYPTSAEFTTKGVQTIPIAVTVPFSHVHGTNHIMTFSAISELNASAIVERDFGVYFADPPQPGGHHNEMFLHAEDPCGEDFRGGQGCPWTYMSTANEPEPIFRDSRMLPEAAGDRIYEDPRTPEFASAPARASWWFDMRSGLDIGLDFDISKTGSIATTMRFEDAWTADITAELLLVDYSDEKATTRLIASGASDGTEFAAGVGQDIEVELVIEAWADLIHPERYHDLVLIINATDTTGTHPLAMQGSAFIGTDDAIMTLPLLDYHEPVDLTGLDFSNLYIERLNSTFKWLNPGNSSVFGFNISNQSPDRYTLDWEIVGPSFYVDWAKLQPTTTHLPAGKNGSVVVTVTAPLNAKEGDTAELLLVGTAREDPNIQLYGRIVAAVVEEWDIEDESTQAVELEKEAEQANERNKKSPGFVVIPALIGAGLLARRRS